MFGQYLFGFGSGSTQKGLTLSEGLLNIFEKLKKLHAFDPVFFKEITMYNSDSRGGKIVIDLSLSTKEIHDAIIDHYIFYKKSHYKRLDHIILTPEVTSYHGFTTLFFKYKVDNMTNRQIQFTTKVSSDEVFGVLGYIDVLTTDKDFDWYVNLFKTILKFDTFKSGGISRREYIGSFFASEDLKYANCTFIGNPTFLSNKLLGDIDISALKSDFEIEDYLHGKILYVDKSQLFDHKNEEHVRKGNLLRDFLLNNGLFVF